MADMSGEVSVDELRKAVERMYRCSAEWLEPQIVQDKFRGKIVWSGIVQVFKLSGHPSATRCYAWSSPVKGGEKRRFFAVLQTPPVETALDAVRAAIVQEERTKR